LVQGTSNRITALLSPLLSPRSSDLVYGALAIASGAIQQSTANRAAGARRLSLRLREQPRRRRSTTLLVRTSSGSAAGPVRTGVVRMRRMCMTGGPN